jgi:putative oxidoreductase
MILAGALIPLSTIPMAIVLLVAIFTVHLPNGFSSIKLQSFDAAGAHFGQPGYETDLLYLAGLVALCVGGAGPMSIDGLLSGLRTFGVLSVGSKGRGADTLIVSRQH